jgi:drug/metabolite transporter (DMT)-like permease
MANVSGQTRIKGLLMALTGASLWGLSGTVAQTLFQHEGFRPEWLVTVRMLVSGILLLLIVSLRGAKNQVWSIWKEPSFRTQLTIFGIFGMLGAQYTYFAAIQTGNAATATLLQFLGPMFIVLYVSARLRKLPDIYEGSALVLALLGTFLLVTNGSLNRLSVPGTAVLWGLASGITAAFYTLYSKNLLVRWHSGVIVGWGMVIGGIGMSLISPPWYVEGPDWSLQSALFVVFVIVFGTLVPFYLFIDSLRFISPSQAGLLSSAEPLSAVLASLLWLQAHLGLFEAIGGVCIIGTVFLLSRKNQKQREESAGGAVEV